MVNALSWIKSYLHDRTQSVTVHGKLSGKRVKDCDVSQGSVLGPDLYSDFTRPLGDLIGIMTSYHLSMQTTHKIHSFQSNSKVDVKEAVRKMELCCAKV